MNKNIEGTVRTIRDLRKCGMVTVFSPAIANDGERRIWCVKAAALLNGHDLVEFDTEEFWQQALPIIAAGDKTPSQMAKLIHHPLQDWLYELLREAEELFEVINSHAAEQDGKTIRQSTVSFAAKQVSG